MESSNELKLKAASLLPWLFLAASSWPSAAAAEPACPAAAATHVRIGAQRFRVEVAASPAERERGLSGRPGLPAGTGMWFVLPEAGFHGFWMQDMRFPIDLVWLGPDQGVLGSQRLAPCGTNACPIHHPPAPASYVLEVNAGGFAGSPGDRAEWSCAP